MWIKSPYNKYSSILKHHSAHQDNAEQWSSFDFLSDNLPVWRKRRLSLWSHHMFASYKCRMIACACLASLHCAGFASWPFPVTVNRPACAGIVFSHVCLKIACQWQCRAAMMSGGMHCLCVLRLPASDIAKSHWLHLFLLLSSLECEFVCASGCLPVPVKRVWVHCLPEITPWLMVTVMFM